jgi:ADP-ribose pyrophosphatase YjhB (NUDIX family)
MKQAVFVVVQFDDRNFAATTRAADRGEAGKIGFPGGKVDPGETLVEAAIRESAEEGWVVDGIESAPFFSTMIDGFEVSWFRAKSATMLESYKEQHRIKAIPASYAALVMSGYGNDLALEAF